MGSSGTVVVLDLPPQLMIRLSGSVDFAMARKFPALIDRASASVLVVCVDLAEVDFIDSTGIGLLVHLAIAGTGTARLQVIGCSDHIQDMVRRLGLTELMDLSA